MLDDPALDAFRRGVEEIADRVAEGRFREVTREELDALFDEVRNRPEIKATLLTDEDIAECDRYFKMLVSLRTDVPASFLFGDS